MMRELDAHMSDRGSSLSDRGNSLPDLGSISLSDRGARMSHGGRGLAHVATHVVHRHVNPHSMSRMASYDVASNICRPLE